MGSLQGNFSFTGSISNVSAYNMRGHDKTVLRMKGGATKSRIKRGPEFKETRMLNQEWVAVTGAAADIRGGLSALKPLADYNTSGPLNALVKKIQVADTVNPKGTRSIFFTHQPDLISSFQYNRNTIFDSIVRQPMTASIDPATGIGDLEIPALQPAINFFPHPLYSYCRIVLSMAAVSDFIWDEVNSKYIAANGQLPTYQAFFSPWALSKVKQPSASYQLGPSNNNLPGSGMIAILGVGIQYGSPGADGSIEPVPYVGAAKILKCI